MKCGCSLLLERHTEYVRDTSRGMGHARRYAFTSAVIRRRRTGRKRLVHMKLCTWVLISWTSSTRCMQLPLPFIPVGFRAAETHFMRGGIFTRGMTNFKTESRYGWGKACRYARCHCGCLEDGKVALCPRCLQTCLNVSCSMHYICAYDELQYLKIAE